jgi:hypothetical protein
LIVQKRSLKNVSTAKTLFLPDSCERNQIASASALQQKCATLKSTHIKNCWFYAAQQLVCTTITFT